MTDDGPVYYVISDLHIGGDEQLEEVEFLDELLEFLQALADSDEAAELIINGDAFGLWEFTGVEGSAKFDILLETYPRLFEQLQRTGETVPITLLPGNHDHELAAYDTYTERFAEYNVDLVVQESMIREIGEHAIWFEHGHQRDSNNRYEDFGNPHEKPLGYHYNTRVISRAGQLSDRGRFNWLKDIQAVTPTQRIGSWFVSKYFYREMNPVLRYAAVPFLLLFNISVLLAILAGLDLAGIWSMPVNRTEAFLGQYGLAGAAVWTFLSINVAVAGLLVLVGTPLYLYVRDFRMTIDRFGVFETPLTVDPNEPYADAARNIFAEHPDVTVFCYGHTHRPTLRSVDGGLLVNSGTWLKRLHRREVIAGVLPPVFYPSYQLGAVRISSPGSEVHVEFVEIEKPSPKSEELTMTERLLTLGRAPSGELPGDAVVDNNGPRVLTD